MKIRDQKPLNRNPGQIKTTRAFQLYLAVLLTLSVFVFAAEAHDPGLSSVEARIESSCVTAVVTMARGDVEALLSNESEANGREPIAAKSALEALAASSIEVNIDGRIVSPSTVTVRDDGDAIHFDLSFDGNATSQLSLRSLLMGRLPRGHRQYASINDADGVKLTEKILDAKNDLFDLGDPSRYSSGHESFAEFFRLGVEHILTGYDHLVFLFGLLIIGVSFRQAAQIITSFTIAHSVTLGLATLDVVRLPPSIVEPLIAVSIVYVGIENILRREWKRRWLLTFGFGLIHGFGFASVLKEMGVGLNGGSVAAPLLSFNLGVETSQIAIAAIVLPLIWKLHKRPSFVTRLVPICSLLIAIVGAFWFVERMFRGY